MDDGSRTPEGFYLNTHSFSYTEQLILIFIRNNHTPPHPSLPKGRVGERIPL